MADKELLDVELKLRNLKEAQKFTEYMKEADKSASSMKKQMAAMKTQLKQLSSEAIAFQRALKIPPAQAAKLIQTGGVNASLTNAQTKGQINQFKSQAQQVNATLINTYTKGFKDLLRAADNARVLALTKSRQTVPAGNLQGVRDQLAAQRFRVAEKSQTLNPNNQNHLKALATETKLVNNLEVAEKRLVARERERLAVARQQQTINQAANSARLRSQNKELLAASREFSVQRTTGDGGASLFKIQGQLLANYLVMNKVFQLFSFGTQFVLQLDQAFRQLQAITATTETEMAGLREELIAVSEQTKFTAVEVAEAATVLGQAGFSTTEIKESIQDITFLATAVGTDLKTAVDLTTSTLAIFNLRAEETGHVANVLTGAINNSKLTLEKLSLGLQFAGNTAAQAGATFEETVSILGAMANAGIRSGSTLGTGLRQVLVSFLKPTKKMTAELEKVGLTMEDIDVKSNGLVNVFQTLSDAGFGASNAFAGMQVRAAAAFLAVSNNLDVARELEEVLLLTNAAAAANEVQMRSLSNSLDKFRSILGTVIVRFSEPFKEFLISATNLIGGMLSALGNLGALLPIIGTALIGLGSAVAIKRIGLLVSNLFDVNIFARKAGVSMAFMGAAAGKSAVGVRLLGAATAFLKANLVSLTIGGLIAASTAFKTFGPSAEDAAARLDKLKAAVDEADGAMETSNGRIASVDDRIKRLSNRYSVLTEDSAALATEVLKAEVEFGKFGLTLKDMENPVDGLIEGLRELKQEFIEIKKLELDAVKVNRINLIEEKARVARDRASSLVKRSGFTSTGNNASLGLTKTLRGATASASASASEFERLSLIDASKLDNSQIQTEYITPLNELRRALNKTANDVTEELTRLQQFATANPEVNAGPFPELGENKLNDIIQFKDDLQFLLASVSDLQGSALSLRGDNRNIDQVSFDATESAQAIDEFITSITNGTSQITDSLKGISDPSKRQDKIEAVKENIQGVEEVSEDYLESLIDVKEIEKTFGKALGAEKLKELLAGRQASLNVALAERASVEDGIQEQTDAYVKDLDALNIKILEQRIKLLKNKASKATNTDDIKMLNAQIEEDLVEINSIKQSAIAKQLAAEGVTAKQGELLQGQSKLLDDELENDIKNLGDNLSKFKDKFIDIGKELGKTVDALDEIKKIGEDTSFATQLKIEELQAQINANGEGGALEGKYNSTQVGIFQDQIKQLEREQLKDTEQALIEQQKQIDALVAERSARAASTDSTARSASAYGGSVTQDKLKAAKEARKELTAAEEEAVRVGQELAKVQAQLNGQAGQAADGAGPLAQAQKGYEDFVRSAQNFDVGTAVTGQLENARSAFGSFITDVTSGTKSAKDSFKDMASSIIESLQKVVAEYLITQIITAAFGGGGGGGSIFSAILGGANDGKFIRKADGGGLPRAAIGKANPNRDSVPILARPGEYVLRNSAVQMLGRENLDQMNALGNRRISKSAPPSALGAMKTEPDMVNVYVVSPEQKPQMTAKDVVVAVTEDLAKGGSTKKLVKSIQMGKS